MNRRQALATVANGFGYAAFLGLMQEKAFGGRTDPMAPKPTHFPAKAKSVIFLYMDGGPSAMDTFDPKPLLDKEHGKPIKMKVEPTQFNNVGNVLKSPWKFQNCGESGMPISDLFPNVRKHADDLAVIRSVVANFSEHTNANYFLHSGHGQQGRPSMGAWVTYGIGSESQELPGFIVLGSGLIPPGGLDCFGSGFLPASYQGSLFQNGPQPLADLQPLEKTSDLQQRKLALLRKLDQASIAQKGDDPLIEAAMSNYELAFRMQRSVPEAADITKETKLTTQLYGIGEKATDTFGKQCLIARRLVERGVRFIELLCPSVGHDRWDQHANLQKGHDDNARAVDLPIAGLLADLKARDLLKSTLVIWGGEFGRTPMAQGNGRDHNPFGFSMWMAGGGIKGGTIHGATDEYGYHAIQDKVQVHDIHATMLHLLGLDHKKVTMRFSGRDMRLTDVHGELIRPILA
ncbi:MAG: DUF1501 domain-containing protein [Zavarzinella sp.]